MENNIQKLLGIIEIYTNDGMISFIHWNNFVQQYFHLKSQGEDKESLEKIRKILLEADVLLSNNDEKKLHQLFSKALSSNQSLSYKKR